MGGSFPEKEGFRLLRGAAEEEAAMSGTGAGLRAKLARGKAKEMRPHSKTLCRRMKLHYHNCTDILYLRSQTVPDGELRFF